MRVGWFPPMAEGSGGWEPCEVRTALTLNWLQKERAGEQSLVY